MLRRAIIINPDEYQSPLDVEGVYVIELASDLETQDQEFTYQFGGEGMGAPPHSHDWDEAFFIVKGSVLFRCDGKSELCVPGAFIFVPGGMVHSFEFGPSGCGIFDVAGTGSRALKVFEKIAAEYAKLD